VLHIITLPSNSILRENILKLRSAGGRLDYLLKVRTCRKVEEELCDAAYGAEGRRAVKGYNTSSGDRSTRVKMCVRIRACIGTGYPWGDLRCASYSEYAGAVFFRRADQARARVRWTTIGPSCKRDSESIFSSWKKKLQDLSDNFIKRRLFWNCYFRYDTGCFPFDDTSICLRYWMPRKNDVCVDLCH